MTPVIAEPTDPVYLSNDSLDWALQHAEQFGDTIFLPAAFEYQAIRHYWNEIRTWLSQQNMVKWKPRPGRRLLAPKSRFSFRYITQLDPLEYLAFTALLHTVGPELERTRVPIADRTVFSWRFVIGPNGQMYDPDCDWLQFTERCEELARESSTSWVVVADIADFFPRVYLHPVERALADASHSSAQAYCLLRHIRNWNAFVSYGLPVGVSGSRIIAEATLNDVDQGLIGAGRRYCRYADDIRVFCGNESEARSALEHLAQLLFENHGHTLQPGKTDILPVGQYLERFELSTERAEAESLTARFHELLEAAGIEDDYFADLDYDDLRTEIQEQLDELNLVAICGEQLESKHPNPVILRILLHRLAQLNLDDVVDDLLVHLDSLGHVMDSVVRYLAALRDLPEGQRHGIGQRVISALDLPSTGAYERFCLLSLFTGGTEYDQENQFESLFLRFPDGPSQRELILALGRAGKRHWFMTNRRDLSLLNAWSRRAFLAAFSCVPPDARLPFYRSLRDGADVLETAIMKWVETNPFG